MDDILSSNDIRNFLQALRSHDVRYMIVGASAAALQGAGLVTVDIDIWTEDLTDPKFHEAVRAAGGVYIPPQGLMPSRLGGRPLDGFDLVMHMSGMKSFAEEYANVRWIESGGLSVSVLPIGRIIASKRAANRPKDRAVLPILEDLARTIESLENNDRNKRLKSSE